MQLLSGTVNLDNYNLIMGKVSVIQGNFGTTRMIISDATTGKTGQLKKVYPTGASLFIYPIGDKTSTIDYSPVVLNMTANSAERTIGLNVSDQKHPNDGSADNFISRYWSFSDNLCTGSYTYNATFSYSENSPTDITGNYNTASVYWWKGAWTNSATGYPGAPRYTISNMTQTTGSLCNSQYTARTETSCTVASFSQQPASPAPLCSPASGVLKASASGDGNITYQWQENKAGNWTDISNGGSNPAYSGVTSNQLTFSNLTNTTQYRCIAINCSNTQTPSNTATITVLDAPKITFITPERHKCTRDSALFKVTTTGTKPISFQWTKDGSKINNATNSSFTLSTILYFNAGLYTCKATNECGTDSATVKLIIDLEPNIIDTIPNTYLCEGSTASFTINAGGGNLRYQWTKGGSDIAGGTDGTLIIKNLKTSDGDIYSCKVSNNCGSKTLKPFLLYINQKPIINTNPVTQNKNQGESFSYSLSPTGTSPFKYQWMKNNIPIMGATENTYQNNNITCSDAGVYSCIIENSCGSVNTPISTVLVNGCDGFIISGIVIYDNKNLTPMSNTMVYLKTAGEIKKDSAKTDANGTYGFYNVKNGSYKLTCSSGKAWGGSDPLDALIVTRYFIGSVTISGALKLQAADVNKDNKINPTDALNINKRYINLINKFTSPDWIFEEINVSVSGSNITQDIKAICAGDVNGSYKPPVKAIYKPVKNSGKIKVKKGIAIDIPVYLEANAGIGALGIKLRFENKYFQILDIKSDIEGLIYNYTAESTVNADRKYQYINAAWSSEGEYKISDKGKPIFTIRAIYNGNLNYETDFALSSECVVSDIEANLIDAYEVVMPQLIYGEEAENAELRIYPNPLNMATKISYFTPALANVEINLYNSGGQRVRVISQGWQEGGHHEIEFDATELSRGIYNCVMLITNNEISILRNKKMIITRR
jgi:hypothetical protein